MLKAIAPDSSWRGVGNIKPDLSGNARPSRGSQARCPPRPHSPAALGCVTIGYVW